MQVVLAAATVDKQLRSTATRELEVLRDNCQRCVLVVHSHTHTHTHTHEQGVKVVETAHLHQQPDKLKESFISVGGERSAKHGT